MRLPSRLGQNRFMTIYPAGRDFQDFRDFYQNCNFSKFLVGKIRQNHLVFFERFVFLKLTWTFYSQKVLVQAQSMCYLILLPDKCKCNKYFLWTGLSLIALSPQNKRLPKTTLCTNLAFLLLHPLPAFSFRFATSSFSSFSFSLSLLLLLKKKTKR